MRKQQFQTTLSEAEEMEVKDAMEKINIGGNRKYILLFSRLINDDVIDINEPFKDVQIGLR